MQRGLSCMTEVKSSRYTRTGYCSADAIPSGGLYQYSSGVCEIPLVGLSGDLSAESDLLYQRTAK
jgi:hypothetical protein